MKDVINPRHYTDGGVEAAEYARAKLTPEEFRGAIKFNVLKYISREGNKGGNQDLAKAAWYLLFFLGGKECSARSVGIALAAVMKGKTRSKRTKRRKRQRDKIRRSVVRG